MQFIELGYKIVSTDDEQISRYFIRSDPDPVYPQRSDPCM